MNTELNLFERSLTLTRYPKRNNETLQAWNAGDEYLINHVEQELNLEPHQRILILNDHFGALSCWFSEKHHVFMMSDSFISHRGTSKNLEKNQSKEVKLLSCLDDIPADIDLVLMQLPKSNRLLTWQLSKLRKHLPSHCKVIGVNKAKDIHSSTLNLFEKHFGETTTSLAWKKHRLVFSLPNNQTVPDVSDTTNWSVDGHDITLKNHANVYSGESLDLGARLMLEHIPQDPELRHIIDLGCGNGVLAIKAAQLNPQARITCVDESFMAVESAKGNLIDNLGNERDIQCIANNCLDGFTPDSSYLVMCNPPFHQQQAITDHIAWQMFCDAKQVLRPKGQLIVIGNRQLGYDDKLKRLFGNVDIIAQNDKFIVYQSVK